MSDIKYYALRTGEEPPMEFAVIRHVDGEPEFVASYVNSSYLSYENGVLLKMHERNDALRAENAKLREQIHWLKKGDILHVLTDQEYIDQCERERLMQVSIDALDKENAKLRELVDGFTWCCGHHCGQECPLYDASEPDYCRETSIKRELGIEV